MQRFKIGRVISLTFSVFAENAVVFLPLAALFMAPILIVNLIGGHEAVSMSTTARQPSWSHIAANLENIGQTFGLLTLCSYFLQASVAGNINSTGSTAQLGESLSIAVRNIVPIIAISVLSVVGIMLGLTLLVVPGIILALAWSAVIPVKVAENSTIIDSFRRSMMLTKGYRWQILLLWLMYFLLLIAVTAITDFALGISSSTRSEVLNSPPILLWNWAERVVIATLTAVGAAATYIELKQVKEGAGAEQAA